jgi:hypothetical protein
LGLRKTKVYTNNVSLKYFGTHAQVSAKPLRWHNIVALMKVDLIHNVHHNNMVRDMLSERKEFQEMSTIQILVANVCQSRDLVKQDKGGVH